MSWIEHGLEANGEDLIAASTAQHSMLKARAGGQSAVNLRGRQAENQSILRSFGPTVGCPSSCAPTVLPSPDFLVKQTERGNDDRAVCVWPR